MRAGKYYLMTNSAQTRDWIFALLAGIAIPIFFFGKAFSGVAIALAVIALLSAPDRQRFFIGAPRFFRTALGILLIVTLIAWLPEVFQSIKPLRSLTTVVRCFGLVFVGYLVWCGLRESATRRVLCGRALIVAFAVTIAFALFSKLVHPGVYWLIHHEPWQATPMMTELKPLAALTPLVLPWLLWLGMMETPAWRVAAWAVAAGLVIVIFVAVSRSSIAGILGGVTLASFAFVWRQPKPKAVAAGVASIVIIAAAFIWLKESRSNLEPIGEWYFPVWLIDHERQAIWEFALDQLARHRWTGLGANTINLVEGADAIIPFTNDTHVMPSHPHNWILEILVETGIIGLLAYVSLIFLALRRLIGSYRRTRNLATLSVVATSGGYLVSGMFNFSFWASWWQLSFYIICAMALASAASTDQSRQ